VYLQEALKASPYNEAILSVDPWKLAYKVCREAASYLLTEVMPEKPDRALRARTLALLVVMSYPYELAGLDFFSKDWISVKSQGETVFPIIEEYEYTVEEDEEL